MKAPARKEFDLNHMTDQNQNPVLPSPLCTQVITNHFAPPPTQEQQTTTRQSSSSRSPSVTSAPHHSNNNPITTLTMASTTIIQDDAAAAQEKVNSFFAKKKKKKAASKASAQAAISPPQASSTTTATSLLSTSGMTTTTQSQVSPSQPSSSGWMEAGESNTTLTSRTTNALSRDTSSTPLETGGKSLQNIHTLLAANQTSQEGDTPKGGALDGESFIHWKSKQAKKKQAKAVVPQVETIAATTWSARNESRRVAKQIQLGSEQMFPSLGSSGETSGLKMKEGTAQVSTSNPWFSLENEEEETTTTTTTASM